MTLEVGDWVTTFSGRGIWQIYRTLEYFCLDPLSKKTITKRVVFSKRFVSSTYKRSFKEQSCDSALAVKLNVEEYNELKEFIENNVELYKKFIAYQPKEISSIYNAKIDISKDRSVKNICSLLEGKGVVKDIDINAQLTELGFNTKAMPSWTVQYISKNFECFQGFLAYRFHRVLEF